MKKNGKRIMAYIMSAALLTSCMPAESVFAEEHIADTESTTEELNSEELVPEEQVADSKAVTEGELSETDSELKDQEDDLEAEVSTSEDSEQGEKETTDEIAPGDVITDESAAGEEVVTEEIESEEQDQENPKGISEDSYEMSSEKEIEVSIGKEESNSENYSMLRSGDQRTTKAIKMPDQAINFEEVVIDDFKAIPSEQNNGLYYYNDYKIYFYSLTENTVREVYSYSDEDIYVDSVYPNEENSKFYILWRHSALGTKEEFLDEFDTVTEKVEDTKDFVKFLTEDESSSESACAIGVDSDNRYYLASHNYTTNTYVIRLISPDLQELSKAECENEIYEFSGFDKINGNFYFEGYTNWVYWGYDHDMQALKCGNVSGDTITISDLYMDLLYQQYYTPHYDNAVMLSNGELAWTSTFSGTVSILESSEFDITDDSMSLKGSVSRSGYEEEDKFAQSVGTRVVYNSQTDGIVMYANDNLIVEFDSDFNQRSYYKTEYPVFAMYNYGDEIMVLEKDSDSNYYVETLNWTMPSEIVMSQNSATIKVGESFQLSTTIDSEMGYLYSWSSDDNAVASVTDEGTVFGNKAGTATISAQLVNGAKAECKVTVQKKRSPALAGEISLSGDSSSNISQNHYSTWSSVSESNLIENEDKTLTRVESTSKGVLVENYSADGKELLSQKTIKKELGIFGGCFSGEENNYLVFGQTNSEENDKAEVVRVVKYSKEWSKISDCKIYGSNTTVPFDAGSLRMIELDGKLYIYTAHEMYADSDGINHQANMLFTIDEDTMEVTDSMYDVSNLQDGYVSHSFNQFIQTDGTYIYRVDHSESDNVMMNDQYLSINGITLTMYYKENESTSVRTCIPVQFDIHDANYTGASIGGFELGSGKCIIAYAQDISEYCSYRNIYISVTDQYFNNSKIVALTGYNRNEDITCRTPQLVKINENLFLVMWEESNLSTNKIVTKAMTIDANANTIAEQVTLPYRLSDCQPILTSEGIVEWYVTNETSPKLYSINPYELSMPGKVSDVHASANGKNKILITWKKSATADGYLIYAQKNKKYAYCGMTSKTSYVDTKALDTDYNFYWVYPYKLDKDGKRVINTDCGYVYAKGVCASVTNLKAANQKGAVKLTWTKSADADGYLIYGKTSSGKYGYIGMTSKTSYVDKKASKTEWNFYWVFPYHKNSEGKRVVGQKSTKYVYGKAK